MNHKEIQAEIALLPSGELVEQMLQDAIVLGMKGELEQISKDSTNFNVIRLMACRREFYRRLGFKPKSSLQETYLLLRESRVEAG